MAGSTDERMGRGPQMDFRAAIGSASSNQGMKTFDNNLFAPNNADLGPSNGSRVSKTNGCLEKCKERPKLVIPVAMIAEDVEYFSNHSLYCKFLGLRVSLQFLEAWARRTWELEGEMEIMLLANNYFMVTFNCTADRNRVFEGGPYFYNKVGLFVKPWHVGFNPAEELPNRVPVWVRLPRLPVECCREDVLHLLASVIGNPIGTASQTLGKKVMTFARICVEIDLSRPLPDAIEMCAGSYSWVQQLDYETLPFRCRLCREYGHLQRRCPRFKTREAQPSQPVSNLPAADKGKGISSDEAGASDGFVQVKSRNQNRGRKRPFNVKHDDGTFNRFEVLDELSQQEVNPGLINLDQRLADIIQEEPVLEASMDPQEEGGRHLKIDQQGGILEIQEPLAIVSSVGVESSAMGGKNGSDPAAKSKPPPKLGILQKDFKKSGAEKFAKPGRKKDMEKIKLAGENLVESGAVRPLDSIFTSPLK